MLGDESLEAAGSCHKILPIASRWVGPYRPLPTTKQAPHSNRAFPTLSARVSLRSALSFIRLFAGAATARRTGCSQPRSQTHK